MPRAAKPTTRKAPAKKAVELFQIKNRFTGEVLFTAELTCSPDTLPSVKLGLAVKAAVKARANLSGSNLSGSDLRPFKADFFFTLLHAKAEVPALIAALREGRVDGSQYEGECACLVGTLANARGEAFKIAFPDASADHPAERWFMMIRKGDKAGDDSGGGFAVGKALEWALEFCAIEGIALAELESA